MKYVYIFGEIPVVENPKLILGGKGYNLGEMTRIGLPVPPGFTISAKVCIDFNKTGRYPNGLEEEIENGIKILEEKTGKKFGDPKNPLLVSVRSGAAVSMPGMMDTILNLGLNDVTVDVFSDKRFAYDCYRRLIQMFGNVVLDIDHSRFDEILEKHKQGRADIDLTAEELKKIVEEYKILVKNFPQEPRQQLKMAIDAVFKSWNNERAKIYRKLNNIPEDLGTAVNVQVMVFGNLGNDSATGVGFTRNPSTGEKEHYGEYLINAQGEDVVAGIRTPKHIDEMKNDLPEAYEELIKIYDILEKHYKDMQDFEFTIEHGKLYMLQTRTGKRTARAAVKIAVDMVKEGLIDKKAAVLRVSPQHIDQLLHKQVDPDAKIKVIAKGLPASPGAAVGKIVFTPEEAENSRENVILVRPETSPEDIKGMVAAQGILTTRGGLTSHAAVVARGMGKPAIVGAEDLTIEKDVIKINNIEIKKEDTITIDGSTGNIILGEAPLIEPKLVGEFAELMKWADSFRTLGVRANADTPKDAERAKNFGAEGIGLCRTEHMFFEGERIKHVREMILAESKEEREKALEKLKPMQKQDFVGIFKAMDGLPVTIRLLDPPLHEFLPKEDKQIEEVAKELGISKEKIKEKVDALSEINPMLGFRGCRLGIIYPEIYEMQVRAIFEAADTCKKQGICAKPEIMIPVLGHVNEMKVMKELVDNIGKEYDVEYKVGVMMELPRACLTSDEIAEFAEFFSFGTNDLTQTTFGYSRDDVGKFIPAYIEKEILSNDPFAILDRKGVGELIKISVKKGRTTREGLKIGICGEHGGEASSIEFCYRVGLDYVSCSPFRVPIARLSAAHASLQEKSETFR